VSLKDEVARCFDALNRGDPNAFLDVYDPEIELFVPAWTGPDGGLYRGADEVNRFYGNYFAQWADQRWELEDVVEHGPSVVFVMHWTGKGRRSGVRLDGRIMGVMTFSEGRLVSIVHLGSFDDLTAP
jgi:ketosteroid isomerase-like protein